MIDGRANELPDFVVFQTAVKYCLLIIVVPIVSFFIAKTVLFDGLLKLEAVPSSVYSAVVAVLVLHIALGMFIHRAYSESDKGKPVKAD